MSNTVFGQSFSVEDIRRIRAEASIRYEGKTYEEISREIHNGAKVGYEILDELRRERIVVDDCAKAVEIEQPITV